MSNSRHAAADPLAAYLNVASWNNVKETTQRRWSSLRPLSDFFDRSRFSRPKNVGVFTSRLNFNLQHFQSNYVAISFLITLYVLFTNWLLLFAIIFMLGLFRFIASCPTDRPVVILGQQVSHSHLWVGFGFIGVILFFISGATSALFWLASVAVVVVCFHAGTMDPPVEAGFEPLPV